MNFVGKLLIQNVERNVVRRPVATSNDESIARLQTEFLKQQHQDVVPSNFFKSSGVLVDRRQSGKFHSFPDGRRKGYARVALRSARSGRTGRPPKRTISHGHAQPYEWSDVRESNPHMMGGSHPPYRWANVASERVTEIESAEFCLASDRASFVIWNILAPPL